MYCSTNGPRTIPLAQTPKRIREIRLLIRLRSQAGIVILFIFEQALDPKATATRILRIHPFTEPLTHFTSQLPPFERSRRCIASETKTISCGGKIRADMSPGHVQYSFKKEVVEDVCDMCSA